MLWAEKFYQLSDDFLLEAEGSAYIDFTTIGFHISLICLLAPITLKRHIRLIAPLMLLRLIILLRLITPIALICLIGAIS